MRSRSARSARRRRYWLGLAELAGAVPGVGNPGRPPGKWIRGLLRLRSVSQEQQEFAEFYAASRDACLRAVIAGTGDAAQAEDMVAEAFARAWASWAKVRRYSAPRGWVVRAALNTGGSWWRPRPREVGRSAPPGPPGLWVGGPAGARPRSPATTPPRPPSRRTDWTPLSW